MLMMVAFRFIGWYVRLEQQVLGKQGRCLYGRVILFDYIPGIL